LPDAALGQQAVQFSAQYTGLAPIPA